MIIQEHTDPDIFYSILESNFPKPWENDLMLGLTSELSKNSDQFQTKPVLVTIEDDNQIRLAGFITPPWPLLIYMDDSPDEEIFQMLIDYLKKSNIPVTAVNARYEIASRFAEQWCGENECTSIQKMQMILFVLHQINSVPSCDGILIQADETYYDLLYKWATSFLNDLQMRYESENYLKQHIHDIIRSKNAFIWIDKQPVSMVFRERLQKHSASIGYVYTPEDHRNQGYATNCIAEVCKRSQAEGFHYLSLLADVKNPTSNSIYRKIGFKEICDYAIYDFKE